MLNKTHQAHDDESANRPAGRGIDHCLIALNLRIEKPLRWSSRAKCGLKSRRLHSMRARQNLTYERNSALASWLPNAV